MASDFSFLLLIFISLGGFFRLFLFSLINFSFSYQGKKGGYDNQGIQNSTLVNKLDKVAELRVK